MVGGWDAAVLGAHSLHTRAQTARGLQHTGAKARKAGRQGGAAHHDVDAAAVGARRDDEVAALLCVCF